MGCINDFGDYGCRRRRCCDGYNNDLRGPRRDRPYWDRGPYWNDDYRPNRNYRSRFPRLY